MAQVEKVVINIDEKSVVQKTLIVNLPVANPLPVRDESGKPLGSANLSFVEGAVKLELFLDKHRPESFDLEVDPSRIVLDLHGFIDSDGIDAAVILTTR